MLILEKGQNWTSCQLCMDQQSENQQEVSTEPIPKRHAVCSLPNFVLIIAPD